MAVPPHHEKVNTPVPGMCVFAVAFALMSNQAFRHGLDFFGQALLFSTVAVCMTCFIGFLTMSDATARLGRRQDGKDVRNYVRSAYLIRRTFAFTLLASLFFLAASVIATAGETGAAIIVGLVGVGAFGFSLFTYMQGPADPYEF